MKSRERRAGNGNSRCWQLLFRKLKLTVFRDKDRMHLRDMLDVELIDARWVHHVPPELAARLQELLDNPE